VNPNELKEKINNLTIWKKGDQRAPHKPLLILYALGCLQKDNTRFMPYYEVREKLTLLLKDFGPIRKSYHPEEPFVRLTNDGIWSLSTAREAVEINDKWLNKHGIAGGFSDEVYSLLLKDKNLVREIAEIVLISHFPETIHEDILTAVGLDIEHGSNRARDPKFRDRVLKAYEYSCAVCAFNVRLGNNLVGVEAAHIKWHQANGPDLEENGIALCSMHHKLFDRGVFTITRSKEIIVSEEAHGTNGFSEWLMRFHGQVIRPPINPEYQPNYSYINWHIKEVFRGPGRYQVG
jgi:putative restriction endonuclease